MIPRTARSPKGVLVALAAAVALADLLSACSTPGRPDEPDVMSIPFATTLASGSGQWVVVPMGEQNSVAETFWELFYRPTTTSHWTEVTPPGVADSGGLAISGDGGSSGSLTVGFEPSLLLEFSPLAATVNGGQSWSAGTLQGKLAPVAGALAAAPSGHVLVLVRADGGEVYSSAGGLARWAKVTSRSELAATPAGRRCSLTGLTAVALSGGTDVIGGACAKPGAVGILTLQAGAWGLIGPQLPPGYRSGSSEVLRIDADRNGSLSALVAVKADRGAALLALTRAPGSQSWSASPVLNLAAGATLDSTGYDRADGGYLVLYRPSAGPTTLSYSSSAAAWHTTNDLPVGTTGAVFTASGSFDVITHTDFQFKSWIRSAQGTWTVEQSINVPVPTGSNG